MRPDIPHYRELAKTNVPLDCGDNSCRFITKRTGMRTNGGCRCMISRQYALSAALDYIEELEAKLAAPEGLEDFIDRVGGIP